MHKTVTASIGANNFIIEEAAYGELENYLASIRKHFKVSDDADEIIADIEARLGEEFAEKLGKKRNVILLKDVQEVTRTMGTVEDFKEFEEGESAKKGSKEPFEWRKLRLYRDADDQIIGGVAAGIAHFFAIDPLIVRLVFGLSIFVGGFGVLLYILLWILLPEARTTTQKVEMTGGRVTLTTIQERIDRALPPEKRNGIIRKTVAFPFVVLRTILTGIGRVLRFVLPLLGRIIGFFVALGSLFAIAMLTFLLLALVLNPSSPYIGISLAGIAGTASYIFFLLGVYFLALIPLLFILLLATSLTAMRSHLSYATAGGLGCLWFVALTTAAFTASTLAPKVELAAKEYEARYEATEIRPFTLSDFDRVTVGGRARVEITQGDTYAVEIETTQEAFEQIGLAVNDNVLILNENRHSSQCVFFCRRGDITLRVTMPSLIAIELDGAAEGTLMGFTEEKLHINADGVVRLDARDMNITDLSVVINGAPQVTIHGTGNTLSAELNGVGSLSLYEFRVATANVVINGPSRVMVDATESLTGEVNGPGSLYYRSVPTVFAVEEHGPADVEQQDEDIQERW